MALDNIRLIERTGNIDNERAQINTALEAIRSCLFDLQSSLNNVPEPPEEGETTTFWGGIFGVLADQEDLQIELDLKTDEVDFQAHVTDTTNPHSVTKVQVGLGNVPNLDARVVSQITAGEDIGGHRAVIISGGQAFHADHTDTTQIGQYAGITSGAATTGNPVTVHHDGELEEASWTWTPGPIYVSTNGTLTQTKPTTGWIMNAAVALTATRILIQKTVTLLRS